jgi:DNA repair exonuclease SbcCD ATPase subunit
MRYVYFKSLKIVNFLSVGKRPVEVNFKPGLNIITGKNYDKADRANGVGKSTIADAVHFALYGSTIRDLKKENIVNDQAPDQLCEVELEFSYQQDASVNECKIIRTLNPTKCFFYINGEDVTRSGVPQTTELITNTIKTSSEIFQNSVIMTINTTVPFMAQKKIEKRKFIEGILGLEVFSNMLNIARFDYNETKRLLDIEGSKIEESNRSLADAVKQKETYEESKKKRLEVLLTRQSSNTKELSIINEKLSKLDPVDTTAKEKIEADIKALKDAKKAHEKKVAAINKLITEAEAHIKFNTDRIKKLKKVDSKCPHCGKDLAEAANTQYDKDKDDCSAEIYKYTEVADKEKPRLTEAQKGIDKLEVALTVMEKKFNDFNLRKKEVENIHNRVKQLNEWQQSLVVDIEQLNKDSNNFQDVINAILARQADIKKLIITLQEKIDIVESTKFITSETGVKSFIVKKILEVLNARLASYLRRLESNSIVTFNEFFEESITNERGSQCSYFNFSGAERKAIDLAMLFTFQDIRRAQADVWLNLSMFDELFDSSLDEKGIELVLDILKERVDNYNESIYIISHRKESKKYCIGGEIVYLEKKNGITTRTTTYDIS